MTRTEEGDKRSPTERRPAGDRTRVPPHSDTPARKATVEVPSGRDSSSPGAVAAREALRQTGISEILAGRRREAPALVPKSATPAPTPAVHRAPAAAQPAQRAALPARAPAPKAPAPAAPVPVHREAATPPVVTVRPGASADETARKVQAALDQTAAAGRAASRSGIVLPREGDMSKNIYSARAPNGTQVSVDFRLPADVAKEFDGALSTMVKDSKSKEELLEKIAHWALKYTESWTTGNAESLSVARSCANKIGECSERTNFLYALAVHSRERLAGTRSINLDGVKFGFAQVFNVGIDSDHVCMTAEVGGRSKFYEITNMGNYASHGVNPPYGSTVKIGLPEYVATILCNKAASLAKQLSDPNAPAVEGYYQVAARLAPNNAYIALQLYSQAQRLWNRNMKEESKTYVASAIEIMRRAQSDRRNSGYEYIDNRVVSNLDAMSANLGLGMTVAQSTSSRT